LLNLSIIKAKKEEI